MHEVRNVNVHFFFFLTKVLHVTFLLHSTLTCILYSFFFSAHLFPTFLSLLRHLFCLFLGDSACKHIFKIPLCNLVGRSIERPLKSPLVNKVLTAPTSTMVPPAPLISATHSLSMSRMEIKEIASRTRKELLGKDEKQTCVMGHRQDLLLMSLCLQLFT